MWTMQQLRLFISYPSLSLPAPRCAFMAISDAAEQVAESPPAPTLCSYSDCCCWRSASSLPPSQSLQGACSGCQLPHQRLYRLRIWPLCLRSRTDQRHRVTEDGWEGRTLGLDWFDSSLLGKWSIAVFDLSNYVFSFQSFALVLFWSGKKTLMFWLKFACNFDLISPLKTETVMEFHFTFTLHDWNLK